ncbi:MAG: hypothetical protein JW959_00610, partial [Pirellulales bacterium]|nr:hypothetical protein [Pirellulales bacterium]
TYPVLLSKDGKPMQQLYTNQLAPYFRAPHVYLGFPSRFMEGRRALGDDKSPSWERRHST